MTARRQWRAASCVASVFALVGLAASDSSASSSTHLVAFLNDEAVYTASSSGHRVRRVDLTNGRITFGGLDGTRLFHVTGSDLVLFRNSCQLFAADLKSGSSVWQARLTDERADGLCSNLRAVSSGDQILVSVARHVVALEERTGRVLWRHDGEGVVTGGDAIILLGRAHAERVHNLSGESIWRVALPNDSRPWRWKEEVALDGPYLFVARGSTLSAIYLKTGEVVWSRETGTAGVWTLASGDPIMSIQGSSGCQELRRLHAVSGETRWVLAFPFPFEVAATAGNMVVLRLTEPSPYYLLSGRQWLISVDGRDGTPLWAKIRGGAPDGYALRNRGIGFPFENFAWIGQDELSLIDARTGDTRSLLPSSTYLGWHDVPPSAFDTYVLGGVRIASCRRSRRFVVSTRLMIHQLLDRCRSRLSPFGRTLHSLIPVEVLDTDLDLARLSRELESCNESLAALRRRDGPYE